jgi:hypothetical protein
MLTEHTWIFTMISPDYQYESADTRAGGKALSAQYRRNKNCALVEFKLNKVAAVEVFSPDVGTNAMIEMKGDPETKGDVGVYILGNFCRLDGHLENYSATALAGMLQLVGFEEIRKLCLIACHAAAEAKGNVNKASFLDLLCKELLPLTPMIAGWDSYVDVMAPGTDRFKSSTQQFTDQEKQSNTGSKIASAGSTHVNDYVKTNKMARGHKRAVQWQGNKMVPVLLDGGWSDK